MRGRGERAVQNMHVPRATDREKLQCFESYYVFPKCPFLIQKTVLGIAFPRSAIETVCGCDTGLHVYQFNSGVSRFEGSEFMS